MKPWKFQNDSHKKSDSLIHMKFHEVENETIYMTIVLFMQTEHEHVIIVFFRICDTNFYVNDIIIDVRLSIYFH